MNRLLSRKAKIEAIALIKQNLSYRERLNTIEELVRVNQGSYWKNCNLWNRNSGRIYGPEQEQIIFDAVENNTILNSAEIDIENMQSFMKGSFP